MFRELKKKLGEVETVKTLRHGSLLICKTKERKKRHCRLEVCPKNSEGESRMAWGVIIGIPLDEDLEIMVSPN